MRASPPRDAAGPDAVGATPDDESDDEAPTAPPPIRLTPDPAAPRQRLDKALADAARAHGLTLSRERIKALMLAGVVVGDDGRPLTDPAAAVATLAGGGVLLAIPPAAPAAARPQAIALQVVYEDAAVIVIDKPAGLVVHPAAGNADGTLVNALLHHCHGSLSGIGGVARPGIVHRIDKDTSGLIVAAKTDAAHLALAAQFAAHGVHRRYLALAQGRPVPPSGTITGAIGRSGADRKKMALVPDGHGKHAVTHYRTLASVGTGGAAVSLIECRLETGRTHQVRVHLAARGHALLGDPVYGATPRPLLPTLRQLGFARQALHAAELGFDHPTTGAALRFASPLPGDMAELAHRLGIVL